MGSKNPAIINISLERLLIIMKYLLPVFDNIFCCTRAQYFWRVPACRDTRTGHVRKAGNPSFLSIEYIRNQQKYTKWGRHSLIKYGENIPTKNNKSPAS